MAAYSDIVATLGGATSNSYITGPDADQYAALQSWNDAWLAKDRANALWPCGAANGSTPLTLVEPVAARQKTAQRCHRCAHGRDLM